ncbi:hypothetical protein V8E53_009203 [Lactarius tabidus]
MPTILACVPLPFEFVRATMLGTTAVLYSTTELEMDDNTPKSRYSPSEQIHIARHKPRPSCVFLCGNVFSFPVWREKFYVAGFGIINPPGLVTGRLQCSIFPVANAFSHLVLSISVPWMLVSEHNIMSSSVPQLRLQDSSAPQNPPWVAATPSLAAPLEQARPCQSNHA